MKKIEVNYPTLLFMLAIYRAASTIQYRGKKIYLSWRPGQIKFQAGQAYIFTRPVGK